MHELIIDKNGLRPKRFALTDEQAILAEVAAIGRWDFWLQGLIAEAQTIVDDKKAREFLIRELQKFPMGQKLRQAALELGHGPHTGE